MTVTARVGAGVREGGQFAATARPEPGVSLPAPARVVSDDVDELEGSCWEVPDDVATDRALAVPDFPLDKVSWWAARPGTEAWCYCGSCPEEPRLLPPDADMYDVCSGTRIAHYAACIERGDEFPPLRVLHDPAGQDWNGTTRTILVDDGHHRLSAYLLLGRHSAPVDLYAADYDAAAAELA